MRKCALGRVHSWIGQVVFVDMLRCRMLESENTGVTAVLRGWKPTFEIYEARSFRDHTTLIPALLLASLR